MKYIGKIAGAIEEAANALFSYKNGLRQNMCVLIHLYIRLGNQQKIIMVL